MVEGILIIELSSSCITLFTVQFSLHLIPPPPRHLLPVARNLQYSLYNLGPVLRCSVKKSSRYPTMPSIGWKIWAEAGTWSLRWPAVAGENSGFPTASEEMRVEVALTYMWKYNVLLVSWWLRDVQEVGTPCFSLSTHASLFSCHFIAYHNRVINKKNGRMYDLIDRRNNWDSAADKSKVYACAFICFCAGPGCSHGTKP